MQTQRIVNGASSPESTFVRAPVVPQRSARRATARRASNRRATARQHQDHVKRRMFEYMKDHPQSTTGEMAKGLNANRGTIAAEVSHMVRAGEITRGLGDAIAQALSDQATSNVRISDQQVGPTIIAALDDGPLRGMRIEAQVVEGRPPSTVDVRADDEGTCRYCLAAWTQSGPSAVYTFLYRV
jgi:capsid protein